MSAPGGAPTAPPPVHRLVRRVVAAGWRGAPALWRAAERTAPIPATALVPVAPGTRLVLAPRDYVSGLVYRGLYERAEAALLTALLDEGDRAVDVGANVGYFTALMAARVGPRGAVLAVEPGPSALGLLRRSLHHLPGQVTLLDHALGDAEGTQTLYVAEDDQMGLSSMADPSRGRPVPAAVRTLDRVLLEHGWSEIALVKVDVEGFEPQVFAGATAVVEQRRARALLVEVLPDLGAGAWAAGLLQALGPSYTAFEVLTVRGPFKIRCRLSPLSVDEVRGLDHQCNLLVVRADAVARVSHLRR